MNGRRAVTSFEWGEGSSDCYWRWVRIATWAPFEMCNMYHGVLSPFRALRQNVSILRGRPHLQIVPGTFMYVYSVP